MWTCMLARHIWDVKIFGSVARPLHLWNGVYQTFWRCRGISHAGWHSHWRKSTKFHPSSFLFIYLFFAFLCISLMASPPLWSILKYLDNDWNKLILCADIHDPQGRNPTGSGYYPLAFSFEECFLSLNHPWNCLWKQCGKGQALSEKILGRWLDDPSVNQCWSQASCNQSDQQQESAYCGASC